MLIPTIAKVSNHDPFKLRLLDYDGDPTLHRVGLVLGWWR